MSPYAYMLGIMKRGAMSERVRIWHELISWHWRTVFLVQNVGIQGSTYFDTSPASTEDFELKANNDTNRFRRDTRVMCCDHRLFEKNKGVAPKFADFQRLDSRWGAMNQPTQTHKVIQDSPREPNLYKSQYPTILLLVRDMLGATGSTSYASSQLIMSTFAKWETTVLDCVTIGYPRII